MNIKKGLSRIMSALLAAMSFVGQASAAPAGKKIVKKVKNVGAGVGDKRRKKEQNEKIDVGGRKRRGKAISAYVPAASPFEDPRNWAIAVLSVSTLGLGITAFCKHRKALEERSLKDMALKQQGDVALFCSLAEISDYMVDVLWCCRVCEDVVSLEGKLNAEGSYFNADDGKVGAEVKEEGAVWSGGNKFFCNLLDSSEVFVGPVARTLRDDIDVFVDRCLLNIVGQFVDVGTNKRGDNTVVDFRDHLMQSVGKKCGTLRDENKLADAEKLREKVDAVFRGADWVRKYLYESLSKFEEKYNKQFESKGMDLIS